MAQAQAGSMPLLRPPLNPEPDRAAGPETPPAMGQSPGRVADHSAWLPATALALHARGALAALPAGGPLEMAVLLADVAGFTALTERLAESGPAGAERIAELIERRFGALIEMIDRHGGDITHFAGDAIVAIWPVQEAARGDLADAVCEAALCALGMQALPAAVAGSADPLPLRTGVSAGAAWWAALGHPEEQVFLVGGAPLAHAGTAAAAGAPGEVMLDPVAGSLLPPDALVAPATPETGLRRLMWLAPPRRAQATGGSGQIGQNGEYLPLPRRAVEQAAEPPPAWHTGMLPRVLRHRLATQRDWLAEFRRITVLFAAFGDIDFAAPAHCGRAQAALRAVQAVVAHFDGAIHQFIADGPGATLIAAWGLPSVTHEDDARRGVEAALAIARELEALGLASAIGVTTGRVFSGVRSSARRRDWSVMGDRMNLAARLMRAAGQGVLCDEDTALAAAAWLAFERLPAIRVKGKAQPVAVLRPQVHRPDSSPAPTAAQAASARAPLVGREPEIARLQQRLAAHAERRQGGVLIIEGEAGIGKSALLGELEARAAGLGLICLRSAADAIESATAYFVWRRIARLWFGAARDDDTAALRDRVRRACADDAALRLRAPLLNDLLALDLPESEVTAPMEPQGRAEALRDLVGQLLRRHALQGPLLVMLDDAHWFDSASWALVAAAQRRAPEVLFVIGTRPIAGALPPALAQLEAGGAETLKLSPLAPEAVLALVCGRFGVAALPPQAAALLRDKAQGNPFFSEQLAVSLLDAGHLVVEQGACRLARADLDLGKLGVPDTVQGVVTGRIDRLGAGEQLTLKVASVIGRSFAYRVLHDVYPLAPEREALRRHLDELTRIDLTRLDRPEPELAHLFTHVITQEVAYDLMSFAQRRQLHRAIAAWFEERHAADLTPFLQLLAYHWDCADDPARALVYLERAAAQALNRFANEEVLRAIAQARLLAQRGRLDIAPSRRARWEWQEGEALLKLARYSESRRHFQASLQLLGRPVPRGRARLVAQVAVQALRQALRRSWTRDEPLAWAPEAVQDSQLPQLPQLPQDPREPGEAQTERAEALLAVHLHQRLAEVAYWEHDILSLVHGAVASLNLAEPQGLSRQLQLAHQVMGFVAGLAGSQTLFKRYSQRAQAVGSCLEHLETAAFCAQLQAIYFNGQARWAEMEAAAQRAEALFERIGERFRWQTCVVLRAWGTLHQGEVAGAQRLFEEAQTLVQAEGPTQVQVWCSAGLLAVTMAQAGKPQPQAIADLEQLLARGVDHSDAILCHGLLTQAHERIGDTLRAQAHAEQAAGLIDKMPPASFHTLLGNAAVAEWRLARWQQQPGADARRAAGHALRGLGRFALACPIGEPAAWRARAAFARLDGKAARAERCLAKARAAAARLGMRLPAD